MSFIEIFILNIIYILFPLCLYLFYFAYSKTFEKKTNTIILDFCLLSMFYLLTRFSILQDVRISIIILNVPLLIGYLNKRVLSIFMLSILISYNYMLYDYNLIFIIIEYIIYYLLYLLLINIKENKNLFVYIFIGLNIIFAIVNINNYINVTEIIFIFTSYILFNVISIYVIKKGKEIIKLEITLNELKKEKQIHTSLFKITHEIKNPIAVCKGYLDMFDINNIEHSRKYIPIIRSEIERTLLLLQDFLDCNHLKINKDILDINLLLEDVEEECKPLIKEYKINYISCIDENELYIEGDYERLKQVLINVIKNSIEASKMDKDSYIKVDTIIHKDKIDIIVEDNGEGITKDQLKKIKQPFYTTKKNGTGLGVTLSTEIIEAHNGKILYTSSYGEWTKVKLTLPIYK